MKQNKTQEYNENTNEELEDIKEPTKNKQVKPKKITKTKKVTKKARKPKPKVVYKYRDKKSHSGVWLFLLTVIILILLAVIGYLIYVNYYQKEENPNNTINNKTQAEEVCVSKASKYNISSGLAKCSSDDNFKLVIYATDLSFDITRTKDEDLPYLIKNVYYKENLISAPITNIKVNENWKIKTEDDIIYLLLEKGSSNGMQNLIVLKEGNVIYSGTNANYKLVNDVAYTKYTTLGLEEVSSCDTYEKNGTLETELWTEGKLIYENGTITEQSKEAVLAKDVCKN